MGLPRRATHCKMPDSARWMLCRIIHQAGTDFLGNADTQVGIFFKDTGNVCQVFLPLAASAQHLSGCALGNQLGRLVAWPGRGIYGTQIFRINTDSFLGLWDTDTSTGSVQVFKMNTDLKNALIRFFCVHLCPIHLCSILWSNSGCLCARCRRFYV